MGKPKQQRRLSLPVGFNPGGEALKWLYRLYRASIGRHRLEGRKVSQTLPEQFLGDVKVGSSRSDFVFEK